MVTESFSMKFRTRKMKGSVGVFDSKREPNFGSAGNDSRVPLEEKCSKRNNTKE